jgi:hypothetical protein
MNGNRSAARAFPARAREAIHASRRAEERASSAGAAATRQTRAAAS